VRPSANRRCGHPRRALCREQIGAAAEHVQHSVMLLQQAISIALSMNSTGVTLTGQPGPCSQRASNDM